MFSRRDSQSNKSATDTRSQSETLTPTPIVRPEPVVATPSSPVETPQSTPAATSAQSASAAAADTSLIAAGDVFEGKLITTNGVRVLGTVRGTIESKSNIQVDSDAMVEADITAENVTIAGTYKGNLNCNGRLEITSTGRASGELETGRILLHEGGFFEGTLHMKPDQPAASASSSGDGTRRRYGANS